MSTTSKSPRKVLLTAWRIGKDALPQYAHRHSPHTFTQPQLFACLALKTFFKTDDRGVAALLHDTPGLCQAIRLRRVPHFTTLQKAAQRLIEQGRVTRLLSSTVRLAMGRRAASTRPRWIRPASKPRTPRGTTCGRWQRLGPPRKPMFYRRFGKLLVLCECRRHLILGATRRAARARTCTN